MITCKINESFTSKQMIGIAKKDNFLKIVTRSKQVKDIEFLTVVGNIMKLRVRSATDPNKWYVVSLRVLDKWDKISAESFKSALVNGRIAVRCTDPSYKYWGYHYILSVNDSTVYNREKRYPIVRNPNLKGVICKHLLAVLTRIPLWRFSTVG